MADKPDKPVVDKDRTGRVFARLVKDSVGNDVIAELLEERRNIDDEWHADILKDCVEIKEDDNPKPKVGWVFKDDKFSEPEPAVAPLADRKTVMLWNGCVVMGKKDLKGTYRCDPVTRQTMLSEMVLSTVSKTFSTGEETLAWPDADGESHTFDVETFQTFAQAMSKFVSAVTAWDGNGDPPDNKIKL